MTTLIPSMSTRTVPLVLAARLSRLTPVFFATLTPVAAAPDWENEQVTGINKEPARVFSLPFADREEALTKDWRDSSRVRSLNGKWAFHFAKRPEDRAIGFEAPGYDASGWARIAVPGNWQTQGYGVPIYTNQTYPFKRDEPRVTSEPPGNWTAFKNRNEVGSYRRTFTLPGDWKGLDVFLNFGGVESAFYVWINGHKVGYSQDSYLPAEFRITPFLQAGENTIAVEVYRWSDGSYLEDQDFWRLSGIFRDVLLYASPPSRLRDYTLQTELDDGFTSANFTVSLDFSGPEPVAVTAELIDPSGRTVWSEKSTGTSTLQGHLDAPLLWTAETPHLYTLLIETSDPRGIVREAQRHSVGFKRVEFSTEGELLINGKPVVLKGVNRHDHNPDTGRYVTEEQMEREVRLMKKLNINCVRTSHYPNHPRFLALCSEYGIYLVAEANIESHGYYYGEDSLSHPPRWQKAHVERVVNMYHRDKNQAAVTIWSLGNEAGPGKNFEAASAALRKLDRSRPIQYERFPDPSPHDDMDSHMYASVGWLNSVGAQKSSRPIFICEYAHSMGNATGNLDEYVEAFETHKRLIGGCIWDWVDQGLRKQAGPGKSSPDGRDWFFAYGGDFGDVPNDGNFCCNGIVNADHTVNAKSRQVKASYQPAEFTLTGDRIHFRNELFHTTPDQNHELVLTLEANGREVAREVLPAPAVEPWESATLAVPDSLQPSRPAPGTDYILKASLRLKEATRWAPKGHEVAWRQFVLESTPLPRQKPTSGGASISRTDKQVAIKNGQVTIAFDTASGRMFSLQNGGNELLSEGRGPEVNLYRAPGDNDGYARGTWTSHGLGDLQHELVTLKIEESPLIRVTTVVRSTGLAGFFCETSTTYTCLGNGTLLIDAVIVPSTESLVLPRCGLRFFLPESLSRVEWQGRGPWENYPDRKSGSPVGRHALAVREFFEPYVRPQFMGNREDVRWLTVSNDEGGLLIWQPTGGQFSFSALPLTDEQLAVARHPTELETAGATVLTLDAGQTGIGGGSCGPSTLEKYRLKSTPQRLVLALRPWSPGDDPANARTGFLVGEAGIPQRNQNSTITTSHPVGGVLLNGKSTTLPTRLTAGVIMTLPKTAPGSVPATPVLRSFPYQLDRSNWSARASSEEPGEGEAGKAIDNDPTTYWHTRWQGAAPSPPHEFILDLGKPMSVKGLRYLPRQDNINGRIRAFQLAISPDGKHWRDVATGSWPDRAHAHDALFEAPIETRWLRLIATEIHHGPWATAAEISPILPAPGSPE